MTEKKLVSYFADDGTPFGENKEACEAYDTVYKKVYKMIWHGRVLFWTYKNEFFNDKLLTYQWNDTDKLCYYDWVRKQLENIGSIRIVADTGTPEFEEIWGLLCGLVNFDSSRERQLYNNYETGDLLMLNPHTCRYENVSDLARSYTAIQKDLDEAIPADVKEFFDSLWRKYASK